MAGQFGRYVKLVSRKRIGKPCAISAERECEFNVVSQTIAGRKRAHASTITSKVPAASVTPDPVGVSTTLKPVAVLLVTVAKHACDGTT
jgi:hypothetical protein